MADPYRLVVDQAMANCLPNISTSEAGEIKDRIGDGINGYIVPPDDSTITAERMMQFVNNPKFCEQMGKISASMIAGHTPEKFAADFEKIVLSLLSQS